ncbi:MAG: hypothetical protein LLG14_15825 [Nocardiaceae bacterium]|nr:hypothetical protein [Nocardiaceae bacterium]
MISLDGVLQAPGGHDEDTSGDFRHGGWTAPYSDEVFDAAIAAELKPANYLLQALLAHDLVDELRL